MAKNYWGDIINKKAILALTILTLFFVGVQFVEPVSAVKILDKGSKFYYKGEYSKYYHYWYYKYYSSSLGKFVIRSRWMADDGYYDVYDNYIPQWETYGMQTKVFTFRKVSYNKLKISTYTYYSDGSYGSGSSYTTSRYVKTRLTPYKYFKYRKYNIIRSVMYNFD